MSDDVFEYDDSGYDEFDHHAKVMQEEAYFYHTLEDFQAFVKELGARYVLDEMSKETRELLKGALND
jgi:hypothetical protein